MLKTASISKTLFNHETHSQPINLCIPSVSSPLGSACEADLSSLNSSYKSTTGTNSVNVNDNTNSISQEKSTLVLITLIDKLKQELTTVKQAKSRLEMLYKVSRINSS